MKFSDRIGKTTAKVEIQTNNIDIELRNGLWNAFTTAITEPMKDEAYDSVNLSIHKSFFHEMWSSYFKATIDSIPQWKNSAIQEMKNYFFSTSWYNVYNFIEFVAKHSKRSNHFVTLCNEVLKRELSGYRFIENELTSITDENQIAQIENAISETSNSILVGVNIHLKASLSMLADKKSPDYRNSMKESISAVESLAQVISGDTKAELGKALKIIKEKIGMHSALEQGFIKIYGYTSDGDGIRHSLTDMPTVDLEDAIFMLTSCSAFINYLIVKADKAGIKFT